MAVPGSAVGLKIFKRTAFLKRFSMIVAGPIVVLRGSCMGIAGAGDLTEKGRAGRLKALIYFRGDDHGRAALSAACWATFGPGHGPGNIDQSRLDRATRSHGSRQCPHGLQGGGHRQLPCSKLHFRTTSSMRWRARCAGKVGCFSNPVQASGALAAWFGGEKGRGAYSIDYLMRLDVLFRAMGLIRLRARALRRCSAPVGLYGRANTESARFKQLNPLVGPCSTFRSRSSCRRCSAA